MQGSLLNIDSVALANLHNLRVELGEMSWVWLLFVSVASAVLVLFVLQARVYASRLAPAQLRTPPPVHKTRRLDH